MEDFYGKKFRKNRTKKNSKIIPNFFHRRRPSLKATEGSQKASYVLKRNIMKVKSIISIMFTPFLVLSDSHFFLQMVPHLFAIVTSKRRWQYTWTYSIFSSIELRAPARGWVEQITHFNEHYNFVFPSHNYIQGMIQVRQQNPT